MAVDSIFSLKSYSGLSTTTDFIAELVRAANEVEKLPPLEKERLLQRVIVTIREGRDQVGKSPSGKIDTAIEFQAVAASLIPRTDDEVKTALLDAADMIRTLKILLEAEAEVLRGE